MGTLDLQGQIWVDAGAVLGTSSGDADEPGDA